MTAPHGGTPPPSIDDAELSAYLDNDLSPAAHEIVRQAIQSNPEIAARFHDLAATVSLLRTLPAPTLRRSFTLTAEQLRDTSQMPIPTPHIAAVPPSSAPNVTPLFGAFGAIAAVLLLMLVSADLVTGGFKSTTSPRLSSAVIEQVTAVPPTGSIAPAVEAAPRASNGISAATTTTGTVATAPPASAGAANPTNQPATTSTGLPLALVRAVEVALGIIAIAGIAAAIQTSRGKPRTA